MPEPDPAIEAAGDGPKEKDSPKKTARNRILCRITCLDKNFLTAEMPKNAKGLDLMRRVCDQLNLQEREYFGLLFNHKKEKYWLEPRKVIKTQLKGSKAEFQLAVKFYEPYPSKLKSDYTRYMLCLQVRDDINCERLPCSFGSQALLGSYIVQGELGDYDMREHTGNYLEGMVFGPSQTEELVDKIRELHKVNRGMSPAQCDLQYLEAARKLTMYGIDAHPATDGNNDEILIGVSHAGVSIFKDDLRQNRFAWQKVIELLYKGKQFSIKSRPGELAQLVTTMTFNMPSEKAAKRLYKSCVEHHTFFRLSGPDPPPTKTDTLKKGSKFRYSDRTLYQIRKEGVSVSQDPPKFMRVSSRNWASRYEPATTEIVVVADEEKKKRPHDRRSNDKKNKGDRVAPLSEEEMMATMTMEERDEYKRKMAERLGQITTTTTTTTTTVYYPGKEGEEDEDAIRAREAGVAESEAVAYGTKEHDPAYVIALKEEEERKKKEEEERKRKEEEEEKERKRREEEERERERERQKEKEREEERERERERRRKELERLAAADRADIAARKPPTETLMFKTTTVEPKADEGELLEFSFATPTSSGDTIKRASKKSAVTGDSYKGRVERVQEETSKPKPAPPVLKPKPKREEPYSQGHSTLPARTQPKTTLEVDEEDRRKSADDMDHERSKGVPLITKEELIRSYSPAGSREGKIDSKRPSQKERESNQVVTDIKRQSYGNDLEDEYSTTQVRTEKFIYESDGHNNVYQQRPPPEVKTQSYTINSMGGPVRQHVSEDVQVTETRDVESAPPGGMVDSSRVFCHIPSVTTNRILFDQPVVPAVATCKEQDSGMIVTRTVTIDGNKQTEPIHTETIKHTTMPTEIITKTITIEGDGAPLTAQELKEIMAQQGANIDSEIITTTYTTTTREHRVEKTVSEKMSLVDEHGNVVSTGDPDTDRAIEEAIRQAKEADPNVKVTEVMITRGDESIA